jgi:hypothetical protein
MRLDDVYSIRFDSLTDEPVITAELGGGWLATYYFTGQRGAFVIRQLTIHRGDEPLPAGGLTSAVARDATRLGPPIRTLERYASGALHPSTGYHREEPPLPTVPQLDFILGQERGRSEKFDEFRTRAAHQADTWSEIWQQLPRDPANAPSRLRRLLQTCLLYEEAVGAGERAPNVRVAEIQTALYGRTRTAAHVRDDLRAARRDGLFAESGRRGRKGGTRTALGNELARQEGLLGATGSGTAFDATVRAIDYDGSRQGEAT